MRWCVFCGSSSGRDPRYIEAARELGTELARAGIELVYGGGRVGLMGAIADAALDAGARVIGVIPHALAAREVAPSGLTQLLVVDSMHERKARMADLADGFIALPGGFGTFEEFCEIVTWVQLGILDRPCIIANVGGFYDPLLAMFNRAVAEGFLKPIHRDMVAVETAPERLLTAIRQRTPALVSKWDTDVAGAPMT